MKKPKIAIAQIKFFTRESKHNVDKIKEYIKLARNQNVDIICFPEVCITKSEILTLNHKLIKDIQQECKKNSIWCIIGDIFKIREKEYNMALLIDRKGKIKGKYKKISLYYEERDSGKVAKVYNTDFAKIGVLICWDLAFPKLFSKLKDKGAEIIFCISSWDYEVKAHQRHHKIREKRLLRSLILARAFENLYYVALCNPVTREKKQVPYSAIASPHAILKEIFNKEGLLITEINLAELKKFRKIYLKEQT